MTDKSLNNIIDININQSLILPEDIVSDDSNDSYMYDAYNNKTLVEITLNSDSEDSNNNEFFKTSKLGNYYTIESYIKNISENNSNNNKLFIIFIILINIFICFSPYMIKVDLNSNTLCASNGYMGTWYVLYNNCKIYNLLTDCSSSYLNFSNKICNFIHLEQGLYLLVILHNFMLLYFYSKKYYIIIINLIILNIVIFIILLLTIEELLINNITSYVYVNSYLLLVIVMLYLFLYMLYIKK